MVKSLCAREGDSMEELGRLHSVISALTQPPAYFSPEFFTA